jgi:outer membrane autotransporter protein
VGLAYEHELDGKAKATIDGIAIDVPELKGGSGIGEVGLTISAAERLTLDLGVRGYAGQRQGVTGILNLTYNF